MLIRFVFIIFANEIRFFSFLRNVSSFLVCLNMLHCLVVEDVTLSLPGTV